MRNLFPKSKMPHRLLSVLMVLILSIQLSGISFNNIYAAPSDDEPPGYDIVLIIDNSGRIKSDDVKYTKSYINNFIDLILSKNSANRIAAIEYSSGASILSKGFDEYFASWENKDNIKEIINNINASETGGSGAQAAIALGQSIIYRRENNKNAPVYIFLTYSMPNYYYADNLGYVDTCNIENIKDTELYFSANSYSFHATQAAMSQIVNAKTSTEGSYFYTLMIGDNIKDSHDNKDNIHQEVCFMDAMFDPNGIYSGETTNYDHLFTASLRRTISARSDGKLIYGDNYIDYNGPTGFDSLGSELSKIASFMVPAQETISINVRNSVTSSNVIHPSSIPVFNFNMYKLESDELLSPDDGLSLLEGANLSLNIQPDNINSSKAGSFEFMSDEFIDIMDDNEILPKEGVYTIYIKESSAKKTANWNYSKRVAQVNINPAACEVEYINHDFNVDGNSFVKINGNDLYKPSEAYFSNSFNRTLSLDIPIIKNISHKAGSDINEAPVSFTFYLALDKGGENPVYIDKNNVESGIIETTYFYNGSDLITGSLKINDFVKLAEDYNLSSDTGDYTLYIAEKDESSGHWIYNSQKDGSNSREINIFVNKTETGNGAQISLKSAGGAGEGTVEFYNSYNKGYDVSFNVFKWNGNESKWDYINEPGEKIGEDISRGADFTGADNIVASYINENSKFVNFTGNIINSSDYNLVINALKSFKVNKDAELNLYLLDSGYKEYVKLDPVTVSKKIEKSSDMVFPADYSFTYYLKDSAGNVYGSVIFEKSDFYDENGNFMDTATKQIDIDENILPENATTLYLYEKMPEGLSNNWEEDINNGKISIEISEGRKWEFTDGSKTELVLISMYVQPMPEDNIIIKIESAVRADNIEALDIFHTIENGVELDSVIQFEYGLFTADSDWPMDTKTVEIAYGDLKGLLSAVGEDSDAVIPESYFLNEDNEFIITPDKYYNEETPKNTRFAIKQTEASVISGESVKLADLSWSLDMANTEFVLNRFGMGVNEDVYSFINSFGGRTAQNIYISCLIPDGYADDIIFNISGDINEINGSYTAAAADGKAAVQLKFTADRYDSESSIKISMEPLISEYGVWECDKLNGIEYTLSDGMLIENTVSFTNTFFKAPAIDIIKHININTVDMDSDEEFIFDIYDEDNIIISRSITISKGEQGPFAANIILNGYDGSSTGKAGNLRLVEREGGSSGWSYSKAEYIITIENGKVSIVNSDNGYTYATASFMAIFEEGSIEVKPFDVNKYIGKPDMRDYEVLAGNEVTFTINIANGSGVTINLDEIKDMHISSAVEGTTSVGLNGSAVDDEQYAVTDGVLSFIDGIIIENGGFVTINYTAAMELTDYENYSEPEIIESPVTARGYIENYGEIEGASNVRITVKEPEPAYTLDKIVLNNKNYFVDGDNIEYRITGMHSNISETDTLKVKFSDKEFDNAYGLQIAQIKQKMTEEASFRDIRSEELKALEFELLKGESVVIRYSLTVNEDMAAQFTNNVEMTAITARKREYTACASATIDVFRDGNAVINPDAGGGNLAQAIGGEVLTIANHSGEVYTGDKLDAIIAMPRENSRHYEVEIYAAPELVERPDELSDEDNTIEIDDGLSPLGKINPETKAAVVVAKAAIFAGFVCVVILICLIYKRKIYINNENI